jgi:hypothetical protein
VWVSLVSIGGWRRMSDDNDGGGQADYGTVAMDEWMDSRRVCLVGCVG